MSENETFLERILAHKRAEVERQQLKVPLATLAQRVHAAPPVRSFAAALRRPGATALIAEVKKASPSRGLLLANFDHLALARTYIAGGAAAISVLTDVRFFQGSLKYLEGIRQLPEEHDPDRQQMADNHTGRPSSGAFVPAQAGVRRQVPLLRKDFILDPYQVYEARAYGADALLLIVAALDDGALRRLLALTEELGMEALVEVHTAAELERALAAGAKIVGVNNRDLHSFVTTLETTERLAARLPAGPGRPLLVSESGIFTAADVARLRSCGADAVLVGEALVTAPDIGAKVRELAG